jgi:hypothetical protein
MTMQAVEEVESFVEVVDEVVEEGAKEVVQWRERETTSCRGYFSR